MYHCLLLLLLALNIHSVQSQATCGCSDVGAVDDICDGTTGQCSCRVGVGGLLCDSCLPAFTDLSPQGCRRQVSECSGEGVCQCRPRITGEECDTCSFGFRDFQRGCTPCPVCFDEVAVQFNTTLELYQNLLARLNSTLEGLAGGGADPALLARVQEYRRILEELLRRAINATMLEEELTSEHTVLAMEATSISNLLDDFLFNLTNAESSLSGLLSRLDNSSSRYDDLRMGVAILERSIQLELRELVEEARRLSQQLETQINALESISAEVDTLSSELESQANFLLDQVTLTLENASLALQRLQSTRLQQLFVQTKATRVQAVVNSLEDLSERVRESLDNATRDVPIAAMEASRVLAAVLAISLGDIDLESSRREVTTLESQVSSISDAFDGLNSFLDEIRSNFSELNTSASEVLIRSRELNIEAGDLLNRSRAALLLANESVLDANRTITEARELLLELQGRLSDTQDLSAGLDEVIRNVERAENLSLLAEGEANRAAEQVQQIAINVNTTVDLLEGVSEMLTETLVVATQANSSAAQTFSSAVSLNSSTAELAEEVATAIGEVDALDQAVTDDKDAIATVSCVANDTIVLAEDVLGRIQQINSTILNLTLELNQIEPLPPGRLREVTDVLESLESTAEVNQRDVDMLTDQIEMLQNSAALLRERYTMLRQHRDLLQEILSNVEALNCKEQFEILG